MIATGTDVKPIEIVFFMRTVKSRGYFEQMKGRGVRVMPTDDLRRVTQDAPAKTHFVIVDAVGVFETGLIDPDPPLERKRSVPFRRCWRRWRGAASTPTPPRRSACGCPGWTRC